MSAYSFKTTIKLRQTDAAGVLFYGEIYSLIHDCYETFLEDNNMSVGSILKEGEYAIPIVHSEADYMLPLMTSSAVVIMMNVASVCDSSFALSFEVFCNDKCVAAASTTHVCIERKSGSVIELPEQLRIALDSI